jgi:hypothetical protein
LEGYYYYSIENSGTKTLKLFTAKDNGKTNSTAIIFGPDIHIPDLPDREADLLQQYTIEIKLTAEAIQADFNDAANADDALITKAAWNGIFADTGKPTVTTP